MGEKVGMENQGHKIPWLQCCHCRGTHHLQVCLQSTIRRFFSRSFRTEGSLPVQLQALLVERQLLDQSRPGRLAGT